MNVIKSYIFQALVFIILLACSCQQLEKQDKTPEIIDTEIRSAKPVAEYLSNGNDMGEIRLVLESDKSLALTIDLKDADSATDILIKGRYEMIEENYQLVFENDSLIPDLFGTDEGPDQLTFLNDSTISFEKSKPSLWIWGVLCEDPSNQPIP